MENVHIYQHKTVWSRFLVWWTPSEHRIVKVGKITPPWSSEVFILCYVSDFRWTFLTALIFLFSLHYFQFFFRMEAENKFSTGKVEKIYAYHQLQSKLIVIFESKNHMWHKHHFITVQWTFAPLVLNYLQCLTVKRAFWRLKSCLARIRDHQ